MYYCEVPVAIEKKVVCHVVLHLRRDAVTSGERVTFIAEGRLKVHLEDASANYVSEAVA